MQTCSKCKQKKELSFFREYKKGCGKLRKICKDCEGVYQKQNYSSEKQNAYRSKNKDWINKRQRKRYNENPIYSFKHSTRKKTYTLINNGTIKKCACEKCGDVAEAHHNNYNNPFDITWLCSSHHRELHNNLIKARC